MPTFGSLLAFDHFIFFFHTFFPFSFFFLLLNDASSAIFFYLMYIMPTLGSHMPFTFSPPLYITMTFTQSLFIYFTKLFVYTVISLYFHCKLAHFFTFYSLSLSSLDIYHASTWVPLAIYFLSATLYCHDIHTGTLYSLYDVTCINIVFTVNSLYLHYLFIFFIFTL